MISIPLIAGCKDDPSLNRQRSYFSEQRSENCREHSTGKSGYVYLRGTVFSETYMPASGGSYNKPGIDSIYSFSIDTKFGRKGVEVSSTSRFKKETLDSMIEPGTIVEFVIKNDMTDCDSYVLPAEDVEIVR